LRIPGHRCGTARTRPGHRTHLRRSDTAGDR
jgi:hypothetical protein